MTASRIPSLEEWERAADTSAARSRARRTPQPRESLAWLTGIIILGILGAGIGVLVIAGTIGDLL